MPDSASPPRQPLSPLHSHSSPPRTQEHKNTRAYSLHRVYIPSTLIHNAFFIVSAACFPGSVLPYTVSVANSLDYYRPVSSLHPAYACISPAATASCHLLRLHSHTLCTSEFSVVRFLFSQFSYSSSKGLDHCLIVFLFLVSLFLPASTLLDHTPHLLWFVSLPLV